MSQEQLNTLARRLIDVGGVPESEVRYHLQLAREKNQSFLHYLYGAELIPSMVLLSIASDVFGIPAIDLDSVNPNTIPHALIDETQIRAHRALPIMQRSNRLYLAVSDPAYSKSYREFSFTVNLPVEMVLVEDAKLAHWIEREVARTNSQLMESDPEFNVLEFDSQPQDDEVLDFLPVKNKPEEEAPIVRFVNKILIDAINRGASDIHIESFEDKLRIRYRRDGILTEVGEWPMRIAPKIIARVKVMARMNIAERRLPQDGRIKLSLNQKKNIDFRVNTCPVIHGEKVVLRILDPGNVQMGIDALGYLPEQQALYEQALAQPHGLILVTGPTGSGKTVSLYTGLSLLNTTERNISTAEDPAEINLKGVNQVNVNPDIGFTFAKALKAFLRQDPDIIMVGEIRDTETAEIAIKAAQTGHLVLSTLHTNDAPQTLNRLMSMGVPAFDISSSVTLIIAQRLARRLCPHCKRPEPLTFDAMREAGFTKEQISTGFKTYSAVGCDQCVGGYLGRVGIYQVMPITEAMSSLIMEGGNVKQIAELSSREGVKDLRQSGLIRVMDGVTSLSEINRVTKN